MKRRFAFFDVDQTIYNGFSTPAFYRHLADAGWIDNQILEEDKQLSEAYFGGKIGYKEAGERVMRMLARYLAGNSEVEVANWGKSLGFEDKLHRWVKPLMKLLKEKDFQIYLISGSAEPAVRAIGEYLEVDQIFATTLEVKAGKYTGQVARQIDFGVKLEILLRVIEPKDARGVTMAFGDSSGDAFMLNAVDYPFLINPHEPQLDSMAKEHGWRLVTNESIIAEVYGVVKKAEL